MMTFKEFLNEGVDRGFEVIVNQDVIDGYSEREAKKALNKICQNIADLVKDGRISEIVAAKIEYKLLVDSPFKIINTKKKEVEA